MYTNVVRSVCAILIDCLFVYIPYIDKMVLCEEVTCTRTDLVRSGDILIDLISVCVPYICGV